jgi:hypothetical protein
MIGVSTILGEPMNLGSESSLPFAAQRPLQKRNRRPGRDACSLIAVAVFALFALVNCDRGKRPEGSVVSTAPANSGLSAEPSVKKAEIVHGKIYYDGQDRDSLPLKSMNELLALYTDEELSGVSELSWATCQFTQIEGLARLRNLRRLMLGNCRITRISGLEHVALLEQLNLVQNNIRRVEGLEAVPNLRELHLAFNRIIRIGGLEGLGKLEVLALAANQIEEIPVLTHLKSLRVLDLSGNELRNITALGELTGLQEVSIESPRNHLDEASLRFIEEWNAEHAGKPALQLHSGMSAAAAQEEAPISMEPEAPEPP